jgi:predicted ATPase
LTHLFIDLRDEPEAGQLVGRLLTLSGKQGFPLFDLLGSILEGWLQVRRGAVQDGIVAIRRGLEAMPEEDVYLLQSYCLGLLAQAYLEAGSPEEGLGAVSQAFAFIERYGERFFEAELHRIRGTLLQADGTNGGEAEAEFRQAIAVARRQQARSLELRAQINLSRLWHHQGRIGDAQHSLQQVYERFAGQENASDVAEARTLLDSWA